MLFNVHMDIGSVSNDVRIACPRVTQRPLVDLIGRFTLDQKIQGFSIKMSAVYGGAGLVSIVLTAAQAGGSVTGGAQIVPDIVHQLYKGLVRLRRESVAVQAAALAAEFFPAPVPDVVPEGTGLFRLSQFLAAANELPDGGLGLISPDSILMNTQFPLCFCRGFRRPRSPDTVHLFWF